MANVKTKIDPSRDYRLLDLSKYKIDNFNQLYRCDFDKEISDSDIEKINSLQYDILTKFKDIKSSQIAISHIDWTGYSDNKKLIEKRLNRDISKFKNMINEYNEIVNKYIYK